MIHIAMAPCKIHHFISIIKNWLSPASYNDNNNEYPVQQENICLKKRKYCRIGNSRSKRRKTLNAKEIMNEFEKDHKKKETETIAIICLSKEN